ncbi:MAG: hypothetical protein AAF264_11985 [Pseudomonadota bacterium]
MPDRIRYVVALYEIDRAYGGPEEGGWWSECGTLLRPLCVTRDADAADARATRANRLIERLQRGRRSVSSMAYDGGRFAAHVFAATAPRTFPERRPSYA